MGIIEIDQTNFNINLKAFIYLYGDAADDQLSKDVAKDIAVHWNQAQGKVEWKQQQYALHFKIEGAHAPGLTPEDVFENDNPAYNFFRVEAFAMGNISFVDGLGCNTGYFKLENLINNSTTAAHEFGHTIGLDHPANIDIRGAVQPGIMYPRGTIVDPHFQYDAQAAPGTVGGTMNPFFRKVLQSDIDDLAIGKLRFNEFGKAIIGDFSSVWHHKHLPQ